MSGKRNRRIRKTVNQLDNDERGLLDAMLASKDASLSITHTSEHRQFSGPLPPPEVLAQYERASPGSAAIIISMAQTQMTHRQVIEAAVVEGNVSSQKRGQWFALVVTFAAFASALTFGYMGQPNVAAVLGGTTVVALAGVFVTSKTMQSAERKEKDQRRHPARKPND